MAISDYQITGLIKSYAKHIKAKTEHKDNLPTRKEKREDIVAISEEGIKRLLERIQENLAEKVKKNEEVS